MVTFAGVTVGVFLRTLALSAVVAGTANVVGQSPEVAFRDTSSLRSDEWVPAVFVCNVGTVVFNPVRYYLAGPVLESDNPLSRRFILESSPRFRTVPDCKTLLFAVEVLRVESDTRTHPH